MRNDKLIFRALIIRKDDVNFQEKLTKHSLVKTYNHTVRFYISNDALKKQNVIIMRYYTLIFASLLFFAYFNTTFTFIISLAIIIFSLNDILRSYKRKSAYHDMLSAIIINILSYSTYRCKTELNDNDLLKLLSDIKISKVALARARTCGYLLSDKDLSLIYTAKADMKRDLRKINNTKRPKCKIRIAK